MYSRKTTTTGSSSPRPLPPVVSAAEPLPPLGINSAADAPRSAADDWTEESSRQAAVLADGEAAPAEAGIFAEFRRKLAMGEALSRAVAKLAEALRFSGRITVSFHQGRITKTVVEELHIRSTKATGTLA